MDLGKSFPAFLCTGLDSESLEMTVVPGSGICECVCVCVCVCEWGGRRPRAEPTRKCQGSPRLSYCFLPLHPKSVRCHFFFSVGYAGSLLWRTGSSLLPKGFSLAAASGEASLCLRCEGSSFQWVLLLQRTGSRMCGLQQLQCSDLVDSQHVES